MGGTIDWQALPIIVDLLGVEDVAQLIDDLITLRTHLGAASHG